MPWFVWFCFLTAPPVVGVAFTLSCPDSTRSNGLSAVMATGFFWLVAAFLTQKKLREFQPQGCNAVKDYFACFWGFRYARDRENEPDPPLTPTGHNPVGKESGSWVVILAEMADRENPPNARNVKCVSVKQLHISSR